MRISDWSSDVCSSDLTSQPDHLDRRTLQLCPSPGECEGPHSLISSLLVSILMAGSTPAIVPSASSTDEATTLEIKNTCLEAVNGDEAAEISCTIGRASCRERVCQYVSISGVGVSIKKKKEKKRR